MAVMETKIIQVRNDSNTINETNEAWARWGWSVLSIQVMHSQNTKTYQDALQYGTNSATVETTTINYVTITYQRDKGMANYDRIAELEVEYSNVDEKIRRMFDEVRAGMEKPMEFDYSVGLGILLFIFGGGILGIIYFIYKYSQSVKYKSPENQRLIDALKVTNQAERNMCREEKERILNEAAQLLRAA